MVPVFISAAVGALPHGLRSTPRLAYGALFQNKKVAPNLSKTPFYLRFLCRADRI
jgi:hypothetical protein